MRETHLNYLDRIVQLLWGRVVDTATELSLQTVKNYHDNFNINTQQTNFSFLVLRRPHDNLAY